MTDPIFDGLIFLAFSVTAIAAAFLAAYLDLPGPRRRR